MTDVPPLWFRDPAGDGDFRFWNGTEWTDQVLVDGETRLSALQGSVADPTPSEHEREIRYQVQHEAKVLPRSTGGETFETASVLVINHRPSWHVPRADYRIMDDGGRPLASAKRLASAGPFLWLRVNSMLDHHLRLRLEIRDTSDALVATLDRRRFGSAAAVYVTGALGEPIGAVALDKRSRPPTLRILDGDDVVATMAAADQTARSITITGSDGRPLGRVEKTALAMGEGILTFAQRFVVERSTEPGTDLHRLVGVVPLALDLVLGSIYDFEKHRQLRHDPRMAKLDR